MTYLRNRPGGPLVYARFKTLVGTEAHEDCLDAFFNLGGYVLIHDRIHELLRAEAPDLDHFVWLVRIVTNVPEA